MAPVNIVYSSIAGCVNAVYSAAHGYSRCTFSDLAGNRGARHRAAGVGQAGPGRAPAGGVPDGRGDLDRRQRTAQLVWHCNRASCDGAAVHAAVDLGGVSAFLPDLLPLSDRPALDLRGLCGGRGHSTACAAALARHVRALCAVHRRGVGGRAQPRRLDDEPGLGLPCGAGYSGAADGVLPCCLGAAPAADRGRGHVVRLGG